MEKIASISQFLEKIVFGDNFIYRGHASTKWKIIPSIGRDWETIDDWDNTAVKIEKELLHEFQRQTVRIRDISPKSDIEWVSLMQHHGLPTRLIDFTKNPLVALYFACLEPQIKEDGVVFVSEFKRRLEVLSEDVFEISHNFTYFPHYISDRIASQSGLFIYCAKPNKPLNGRGNNIKKIIINHNKKYSIQRDLQNIGIHAGSIFPGLEGTCKNLSDIMYNKLFEHFFF